MNRYRDLFAQPPSISTRAELDQLRAGRLSPTPERAPAPSPEERLAAYRESFTSHEQRLAELTRRLGDMRQRAERDYAFASLAGRARADFEREH